MKDQILLWSQNKGQYIRVGHKALKIGVHRGLGQPQYKLLC